jgi:hypothetical protein
MYCYRLYKLRPTAGSFSSVYFRFFSLFIIARPALDGARPAPDKGRPALTEHGLHFSTLALFMLFGCYLCYSMNWLCVNVLCHRVTTQL